MNYQVTYSAGQLHALKSKGAEWLVVCKHDIGGYRRGDVKSWHKSYDAAMRSKKPNGLYFDLCDVAEMIGHAELAED